MIKKQQSGFTMVELLIAMAFFSFLLLFITFGFVQVNRSYTRGITVKAIQESSRTIIEDISRNVRISEEVRYLTPADGPQAGYRLCFSGVRYAWNQHQEGNTDYTPSAEEFQNSTGNVFAMVRVFDGADCDSAIAEDSAEHIIDDRAAVQHLSIEKVADETWQILLVVATENAVENGDIEVGMYGKDAQCRSQVINQFCDVARFETVITSRN